jgi:hypothetical protein
VLLSPRTQIEAAHDQFSLSAAPAAHSRGTADEPKR